MKTKSLGVAVLLVLVLFMAQIFVPLVVAPAPSGDNETAISGNSTLAADAPEDAPVNITSEVIKRNKITFVLGTDENRASLEKASMDAAVNTTIEVEIYSVTEAKSRDFSTESVVFLASLDNETVASINQTINESAYVVTYNLSTTISIGYVDDINITKYWVYDGDENIRSLILYMNNSFYDGATCVDSPNPPKGRPNITFVTRGDAQNYVLIERVKDDLEILKCINVTSYFLSEKESESYKNLDLSDQDVIMITHIGYPVQDAIKETVEKAKDNGAYVITHHFTDVHNLSNVNLSDPNYSNITKYWDYQTEENTKRLIFFLGVTFCNVSAEILPPIPVPLHGLYHPDAKVEELGIQGLGVFSNTCEYLKWYTTTEKYNAANCTVGIHGYYVARGFGYPAIDALIRSLESKGANVIFATYSYKDINSTDYFIQDNKSIVDVVISCVAFSQGEKWIKYFEDLNVTPLKAIMSSYASPENWENSTGLSPSEIAWQISLPELDGQTEFIYTGGRVKDPISGEYSHEPVDYQIDWITDRAISWAKLHRMNNSEKKIAIIYYNHGGGKNNLGASYLDISPSLKNLLDAMNESGYEVGDRTIPNGTELIELMVHQGVNVGSWAPGELNKMVSNYSLKFIPVSDYEEWFEELQEDKRKEVIEKWGEPPGEIMVYGNATGKYFVIPGIQFGNVFLSPQPTRGWLQNNSILYHNKELAPHHQYIAFYLWLKKEYGADAIIHFGKHGTQEWLPGKETALSVEDCWPTILIQDIPVVYPYIMDNVAEGTQAKRRGNAVIVDHLTPPIVASGLYGNLSILHEKIHIYLSPGTEPAVKNQTRQTITQLYENLDLAEDLGVSAEELRAMDNSTFTEFVSSNGELHIYLHELAAEFMPYGLHILGSPPVDWKLVSMVNSMLGDEFVAHVGEIYPDPHELSAAHGNCTVVEELLIAVLFNGSSPDVAQMAVLGAVSTNVTADLNTAIVYAENIRRCDIEIPRILDGLSGKYVPPKVGHDPIRNPDALPTGNNFYSFDPRLMPTKEAWEVGKVVADSFLSQHKAEHNGSYPGKVGFVLWAIETMRHWGVLQSEILYLMGVEPVWDSKGRVKDVKLLNASDFELNDEIRPRIDVLITTSGLYRDTYPDSITLLDKAVRLAAQAEGEECDNYVKVNSNVIYNWLIAQGYGETEARSLSMARIFTEAPGNYGTGLPDAISASSTWDNETKLANLYINRMGFIYGADGWGVSGSEIFRQNLADTEAAVHSQSSNLYGVLDNDDYFQYLGGLALAVRSERGETPDLYISNLRDPLDPKTETLESYLQRELRARYFNPKWIKGMMEHDYAGARAMDHGFIENLWGWTVVTPDMITDSMWNQVYDIYVQDSYDLGLTDWFNEVNPWARQSITARMLEASRKDYWDAPDTIAAELAKQYMEAVVEYGVACCHHTCNNLLLNEYMKGLMDVADAPIDQRLLEEYLNEMAEARGEEPKKVPEAAERHHGGGGGSRIIEEEPGEGITNVTETTGVSKTGVELKKPPETASNEKRGKVMKEEKRAEKLAPAFPISGVPLMGIIAVILILVLIGIGLGYKRRKSQ